MQSISKKELPRIVEEIEGEPTFLLEKNTCVSHLKNFKNIYEARYSNVAFNILNNWNFL